MDRESVDQKFARSLTHLKELEEVITDFLESGPFQLEGHEEQSTGDLSYRVRILQEPPREWSLLIGDSVHNARSALDHLAYLLVAGGGGTPTENTCFPITNTWVGYGDRIRAGMRGASKESRDFIKSLRPWQSGDEFLWQLHRLDIIDKHRLLVPVGIAHRGITLTIAHEGFRGSGPIKLPPIGLLAEDRQYPLRDGAEVFRIAKAARDDPASPFTNENGVTFDVAFGDGSVVDGKPIFPTLRRMVDHVVSVVEPLVASLPDGL